MEIGLRISEGVNVKSLLDELLEINFPTFTTPDRYELCNNEYLIDNSDNQNVSVYKILNFNSREKLEQFSITLRSVEKYQKHLAGSTVKKQFEGEQVFIIKYNVDGREIFIENEKANLAMNWLIETHLSKD